MVAKVKKHVRELGRLTPMALVATFLPVLGSVTLIAFLQPIGGWLRINWETGSFVYLASTIFFCGLSLLPTNVIGLVGGWAFGFELGLAILISGIVGSAFISFLINSRISGGKLPDIADRYPKAAAVYRSLVKDNFWRTTAIVILLRISVIMPFALTNFLMASARVPIRSFLIGTAVGMFPRSAAVAFIGSGLSELDISNTRDTYIFALGVAATIFTVIVIATISRRALERITAEEAVPGA
ncbi:MAG: VTT domain-containing protein [Pyrinomonadaceae bacterium]|nr:VTT domain-containing protein [Pyrinomonadaceae bacterium]